MQKDEQTDLARLTVEARRDFPRAIFWTIPISSDPAVEARNIGHQLEKYGGMAGIAFAARLENALRQAGEESWR
ncbi:hypothetical protein GCM10007874_51030 [Labrys miyagiensis]|uniref:Uncharacterized protein n=1 Tax=Labrys miyagiensis TaxID=346912 RepID=A0ABQ6CV01_9HYPH|nr:hypothetical protein [Labrys miyagiensis]GLS22086.1 hypothetical protein GCM10007874_51030 [Labrys miyagiensis]